MKIKTADLFPAFPSSFKFLFIVFNPPFRQAWVRFPEDQKRDS